MKYSILAKNNSSNDGQMCIYQTCPDLGVKDAMSLAWFSKFTFHGTMVNFEWEINYNFVWSETGELVPGVIFKASELREAGLDKNNKITLDYSSDKRAYHFTEQGDDKAGSLHILEEGTLPLKKATVGIGMSGKGTFVVQAQPNFNLTFTPKPKYWIVFGNFVEGEVLDISELTSAAEIKFPPNIYSMTAILKEDNSWDIKETSKVRKNQLA